MKLPYKFIIAIIIVISVLSSPFACFGRTALTQSSLPQGSIITIGLLGFQDESGTNQSPQLGAKIAQSLQQKMFANYKDILPRALKPTPDAANPLTVEQMVALGKQYAVRFIVCGGVLAINSESTGEETQTNIQLYATIVSVEDSRVGSLRGEGSGSQKSTPANSPPVNSLDFNSNEFKNSSVGLALASAIASLSVAIYQAAIANPQALATTNMQSQNSVAADNKNAEAAKDADADAELQQLIAQAEQVLSSGAGSTASLKSLGQSLEGLKSTLAQKANLYQQGKQAEATQLDSDITARKNELQSMVSIITTAASSNNPVVTAPDAQQQNPERKNILATVNEYLGETLNIIQKIQEMRAAFRSANQDTSPIASPTQEQTNTPNTTGEPASPLNTTNPQSVPAQETTEQVTGVVTSDGKPVEGATVTEPASGSSATTANDGTFTLTGVLCNKLATLTVVKSGIQAATGHLDVVRGRANIADFELGKASSNKAISSLRILPSVVVASSDKNNAARTGLLKGTVQDAQSKPVPRALVTLQGLAIGRTDSNGQYVFTNVPEGIYQLTIQQSGLKPRTEQVRVAAAQASSTKTQFTPRDKVSTETNRNEITATSVGAILRGVVFDEENRGIGGAKVFVSQSANALSVITDAKGSYEIKPLKSGAYRVTVSKFGFDEAAQTVSLTASEAQQRDFQLKKKSSPLIDRLIANQLLVQCEIVGQVRAANGSAMANATVEISESGKTAALAKTLTNAKGEYDLRVPQGRYQLKVSQKSFQETLRTVTVQAGNPTRQDFIIKAATIIGNTRSVVNDSRERQQAGTILAVKNSQLTGRITDAKNGIPIQGAIVSLTGQRSNNTDKEGNFVFLNLPPGAYQISIKKNGFTDEERTLTVRSGESSIVNFKLNAKIILLKR